MHVLSDSPSPIGTLFIIDVTYHTSALSTSRAAASALRRISGTFRTISS
jgi:hypothetical protein